MNMAVRIDMPRAPKRESQSPGKKREFNYGAIRTKWDSAEMKKVRFKRARAAKVAAAMNCSIPTVMRAVKFRDGEATRSRSAGGPVAREGKTAHVAPIDLAALNERRTFFPQQVRDPGTEPLLKSGEHSQKIGGLVLKGELKGMPIYTLTLEERASCPVSCRHWSSCYGNNTPYARRFRHGPALEWQIEREIAALELRHPKGFLVRLHNLGDFYSVRYVYLWRVLVQRHEALHVFGYTAHNDTQDDPIAYSLALAVRELWPRFAIRFSNGAGKRVTTISIEHPLQKPDDAFICPAQWTPSGKKTESCSTCALCWSTTRRVAFLQH